MDAVSPPAPRGGIVEGDGSSLAVFEQGAAGAPVVLLVHGYPDTHRIWDRVAAELSARFRVVRYDVRGAGASSAPAGLPAYRLPRLAADLRAVADAVSPELPVHVVGHDWGSIQAWEAVTERGASGRIASYTTISGPCLDHVGYWLRGRLGRPSARNIRQLLIQSGASWYIGFFHLPLLAPAAWRLGLAKRWGALLDRAESTRTGSPHPHATLADDAVRGIALYRANMLPRVLRPRVRYAHVPVQVVTMTRDRYVSPALTEDLERWAPDLRRRAIDRGHWSALLEGAELAGLIAEFVDEVESRRPGAAAAGAGAA
jgi:pimeloyl-ACP methyl ester carboxylesterase